MHEIIVAGVGGLVGWCLTAMISYIVRRERVKQYFVVQFRIITEVQKQNRKWLVAFVDKILREGQAIQGAPHYTQEDFSAIDQIHTNVVELLDSYDLSLLTYFIRLLKEIEVLFDGFCADLQRQEQQGKPLSELDLEALLMRSQRILNHIDILPDVISDFSDLPLPATIKARQGAETFILSQNSNRS